MVYNDYYTMSPPRLSKIWKAHYWFDKNTGQFIQFKGKKGGPKTPDFLIRIDPYITQPK